MHSHFNPSRPDRFSEHGSDSSRRRLSFDPPADAAAAATAGPGEIVIDYQLPTTSLSVSAALVRGKGAATAVSPSQHAGLASSTKRKFEETEEKEIAESAHKRETIVKGARPTDFLTTTRDMCARRETNASAYSQAKES
jgi:hypothetical protein